MLTRTSILAICVMFTASAFGQKAAKHGKKDRITGMMLPVECAVMANGGPTDSLTIELFKENEQVADLTPERHKNGYILELDLNSHYTVVVHKGGYCSKSVAIDTHLPEGRFKYKAYKCAVNLEPLDKFNHSDPWYLDFPSAVVRWDPDKKAFSHSTDYLADIQTKMALLGAQVETK